MSRPLRVLIVEDRAADAELVLHELRRADFEPIWDVVQTEEDYLAHLDPAIDVILADYTLPAFDALDALRLLQRRNLDIPFIVVTGTISEEVAVECMRQGAADYLLKDRLGRLGQAVARALAEKRLRDEQRQAVEALRQSEEQFRLISENVADLIAVINPDGTRAYNSPSYRDLLGDPEALRGTDSLGEVHPEDQDRIRAIFQQTLRTGVGQRAEYRLIARDGTIRFIESQGSVIHDRVGKPRGVVVVSRDVSERRQLGEQLRQSQKMEAIGRLSGGIAHDFNNLLTAIIGFGKLLEERAELEGPQRTYLEEIIKNGERAASLTGQLLAFSRQQVLRPKVLDLNVVVANMDRLLQRAIGEDIDLVTLLEPSLGRVKADPGQIEQVVLNLAVNARDAMPAGGKLTIETANVELDEAYGRRPPGGGDRRQGYRSGRHLVGAPGLHVMLAVSDTGVGMDADTQAQIFEPFFTTKEQGKGTGLGLATVYGIVKQSEGYIWVYSEPGHGTTFKVYLPWVAEEVLPDVGVTAPEGLSRGSETVLLVEDEDGVRRLASEVLQANGYRVLEASNGDEARVACEGHDGPIHLLLTDIVMPGLNGRALASALAALRPEMKVLYMSGYTDDAALRHGVLQEHDAFLEKPFTPAALIRKVGSALDVPKKEVPVEQT